LLSYLPLNIWDNGYPSGGNYWDDYTGSDINGDHIGDSSYNIPGGRVYITTEKGKIMLEKITLVIQEI